MHNFKNRVLDAAKKKKRYKTVAGECIYLCRMGIDGWSNVTKTPFFGGRRSFRNIDKSPNCNYQFHYSDLNLKERTGKAQNLFYQLRLHRDEWCLNFDCSDRNKCYFHVKKIG